MTMAPGTFHQPVLLEEVLEALRVKKGDLYIDATIGGGGHTKGILLLGGKVLGIDVDPNAIRYVANSESLALRERNGKLYAISEKLTVVQGNFANLIDIAKGFGVQRAAGALFDLGVSSHQLEEPKRGFSFQQDAPLDMRMDPGLSVTAADLVNGLNEGELYELFNKYGEEPASRRIACAIVKARVKKQITTTGELTKLLERIVRKQGRIHPATRVFQALRIAVNDELNNLKKGLDQAARLLEPGGRLVVISFHSLEDRIVKNFIKENMCLQVLTKELIRPTREEILANPRSRSAKMRIAEKISDR